MAKMSYVAFSGHSVNVHQALFRPIEACATLSNTSWKSIILGSVKGLLYMHEHDTIHNDTKADNM